MKTLEQVQRYLCNIPSINRGGCGLVAYGIYLWLKKNNQLPDDFEIIYLHQDYDDDFEVNNAFLEGKSNEITACTHALIQYKGNYMDCKGVFNKLEDYDYKLSIGKSKIDKFMQASLNERYEWNFAFNRERYLSVIEKDLGIDFNLN